MEKQAAFKTAVFGFEKESVMTYINTLYNETQGEIAALNKKIEAVNEELSISNSGRETAETNVTQSLVEIERMNQLLAEEKASAERYADGIRSLNNEINRLKMDNGSKDYRIKELSARIEELEEKGKEGEEILKKAREEAQGIIDSAQEEKSKMIFEANADVSEMISRTKEETHRIIHTTNARSEVILNEANNRKAEIDKITYNLSGDLQELKLDVAKLLAEIDKSVHMAEKLGRGVQNFEFVSEDEDFTPVQENSICE